MREQGGCKMLTDAYRLTIKERPPGAQCANGESNKIVSDKKKVVRAWIFNTYWVRNHLVPNPVNSKSIRLKKNLEKLKSKNHNIEKVRTNKQTCMQDSHWIFAHDVCLKSFNAKTLKNNDNREQ